MRIKKKNIREELDTNTVDKVNDMADNAKETIEKTGEEFDKIGLENPKETAADIVGSIVKNSTKGDDSAIDEGMVDCGMLEVLSKSVRPSMTKNELIETVLGKSMRKVIKTLKIKDLRNE